MQVWYLLDFLKERLGAAKSALQNRLEQKNLPHLVGFTMELICMTPNVFNYSVTS